MTARTTLGRALALLCLLAASTTLAWAQRGPQGDPLGFLKRAIADAGAPALTADQETKLQDLQTAYREARKPGDLDTALEAAHKAYDTALVNGDLAGAQAQAAIIASRSAAMMTKQLQTQAKYVIDVAAVLKSGGQWEPLKQKFGEDQLVRLLGGPGFGPGGPGFGRPGGPGGPGFGPGGPGGPGFAPRGMRPGGNSARPDQIR